MALDKDEVIEKKAEGGELFCSVVTVYQQIVFVYKNRGLVLRVKSVA